MNFLNLKFEYFRKNEFLRKTILACLFGAQMGWFNEIKKFKKPRDTTTLKCSNFHSEAPEFSFPGYQLFFSVIKHAGS